MGIHHIKFIRAIFCAGIVILSASVTPLVFAGGRFTSLVCWDGGCSVRPDPTANVRQKNIRTALHAVFASEEAAYVGLRDFIDNSANAPYQQASADLSALQKNNSKAGSTELETSIRSGRDSYLKNAGISMWIRAAATPPKMSSFFPHEGTSGDTITIKGENLLDVQYVVMDGITVSPIASSNSELKAEVPKYIKHTPFTIELRTKFGKAIQSKDVFAWLNGQCTDPKISRAVQEMMNRPARGTGSSGECNSALYGSFSTVEELISILGKKGMFVQRYAPGVTYLNPSGYGQPPGTAITIGGYDLYQVKEVTFGGVPAPFESVDDYLLKTVVPAGGMSGKVRVITYSGSAQFTFDFDVTAPPVIDSVLPASIVVGTPIFIHGKNFTSDIAAMFDSVVSLTIVSRTPTDVQIATSNIGTLTAKENGTLTLTERGGSASKPLSIWLGLCSDPSITVAFDQIYDRKPLGHYTSGECNPSLYHNGTWRSDEQLRDAIRAKFGTPAPTRMPSIISVNPATGAPGGLVTVKGANFFSHATTVQFGGVPAKEIFYQGNGQFQVRIPDNPGAGITVATFNGSVTKAFGIIPPLSITSVTPKTGIAGSLITIQGSGLQDGQVSIGGQTAVIGTNSSGSISATIPKGVKGNVEVKVIVPDGRSIVWRSLLGVYSVNLQLPYDAKSLQDTRIELIAPDGRVSGTVPLIGNAGAGMTNDAIAVLIGNAGAGLNISYAACSQSQTQCNAESQKMPKLIGNAGAGLIGNAGAGLSEAQLGKLIGNAGAGFNGGNIVGLIGNAGAGLKTDLTKLIGNAGAGLAGNHGSGLAGNHGSGLAGNFGSGFSNGTVMTVGAMANISSHPISSLGVFQMPVAPVYSPPTVQSAKPIQQTIPTLTPVPSASESIVTPPIVPVTPQKEHVPTPKIQKKEDDVKIEPRVSSPPSTPLKSSPVVLPPQEPEPTPLPVKQQPVEPSVSPTACNPGIPKYQQPNCIEQTIESEKRSPYDGLPCPGDEVPNYSKIGCIPQ